MRPKSASIARAHGLPKTHKQYHSIPKFRPIIDTTNTTHYGVGKFLTRLLQPLTHNEFTIKDSFDAVDKIRTVASHLFNEGYRWISFDVESLFTNVPLAKTIDVVLRRVYTEDAIDTNLKKRTLKKLIKDCCQKTTFSFNSVLYEQNDGVSMGSSLGPVLTKVIMTELEKTIVLGLFGDRLIKFYGRYVDDTLVLAKPANTEEILRRLNSFHKNLSFTVDTFDDDNVHFLDITNDKTTTDIYRKSTNTSQYVPFESFEPWWRKTAWVRTLRSRIPHLFHSEAF